MFPKFFKLQVFITDKPTTLIDCISHWCGPISIWYSLLSQDQKLKQYMNKLIVSRENASLKMTSLGIQQDGWAKNQCWSSWRRRFSTFYYDNIDYDSSFCGPFAFSALFILLPTADCPWELDEQLMRGQATQQLQFTSWLNGNPVVMKFSCTVNRKYCLRFFVYNLKAAYS